MPGGPALDAVPRSLDGAAPQGLCTGWGAEGRLSLFRPGWWWELEVPVPSERLCSPRCRVTGEWWVSGARGGGAWALESVLALHRRGPHFSWGAHVLSPPARELAR